MDVQLAGIRGKFLLSLNDRPEVQAVFGAFQIERVETTYTVGTRVGTSECRVGEVLVSGW